MGNKMQQQFAQNNRANKNEVVKKVLVQPYREGQVQATQDTIIKDLLYNN